MSLDYKKNDWNNLFNINSSRRCVRRGQKMTSALYHVLTFISIFLSRWHWGTKYDFATLFNGCWMKDCVGRGQKLVWFSSNFSIFVTNSFCRWHSNEKEWLQNFIQCLFIWRLCKNDHQILMSFGPLVGKGILISVLEK